MLPLQPTSFSAGVPNNIHGGYELYQQQAQPYQQQLQINRVLPTSHSSVRGSLNLSGGQHGRHQYRNAESQETTLPASNQLKALAAPTAQSILQEMQMEVGGHNNNNLERLESLERKLSSVLENAEQQDYDTMCQIYSQIINNAELASQKIKANDPLKKQWYKRVLEYQIKEKKYRELLNKQQQKKLEAMQEAAQNAAAMAEAVQPGSVAAGASGVITAPGENGHHQVNQMGEPAGPEGQVTFYPGQGEIMGPQGYPISGQQMNNIQQRMAFRGGQQNYTNEIDPYYAQTGNFPGAQYNNDYNGYNNNFNNQFNQQNQQQNFQNVVAQQLAQQTQQMFSALTNMITDTIQQTQQQVFDLSSMAGSTHGHGALSFSEMKVGGAQQDQMNMSQASLRDPRFKKQHSYQNPHDDIRVGGQAPHQNGDHIQKKDSFPAQPGKSIQELMLEKSEYQANKSKASLPGYSNWEEVKGRGPLTEQNNTMDPSRLPQPNHPTDFDEIPVGGKRGQIEQHHNQMHRSESLKNPQGESNNRGQMLLLKPQKNHNLNEQSIASKSSLPGYSKWEAVNGPMSQHGGNKFDQYGGSKIHEEEHEDEEFNHHQRDRNFKGQGQYPLRGQIGSDGAISPNRLNNGQHYSQQDVRNQQKVNHLHNHAQSEHRFEQNNGGERQYNEDRPLDVGRRVQSDGDPNHPQQLMSREEQNQHPLGRKQPQSIAASSLNGSTHNGKPLIHPLGRKLEAPPRNINDQLKNKPQKQETMKKGGIDASEIMAEFKEHFDKEGNFKNNQSMEFNNQQLTEEEYKAMRREKMKLNHMKRLKTLEDQEDRKNNAQREYFMEDKRAESPFLSQHTFANELIEEQLYNAQGRLIVSRDGAPSQPFTTARHSYMGNKIGQVNAVVGGGPPSDFTQTPIVSTQNRGMPDDRKINQSAQRKVRDPRTTLPKHAQIPLPINPINTEKILQNLPPEIANDADIKQQLVSLAEKQMQMIKNYKEDIERLAREKADIESHKNDQRLNQRESADGRQNNLKRPWDNRGANNDGDNHSHAQKQAVIKAPWRRSSSEHNPSNNKDDHNYADLNRHPLNRKDTRPYVAKSHQDENRNFHNKPNNDRKSGRRVSEFGHDQPKAQKTQSSGAFEVNDDERRHIHRQSQLDVSNSVYKKPILPKPKGKQKPAGIPLRQMIGTKNFTELLNPHHDQLFLVQEMTTLPKPQNSNKKINALSEEDKVNIDELFDIMHKNREFEQIVHRDLWWKNFDSLTEFQRISTVHALIEQYFNHLKIEDHDAFQIPILSSIDVDRKLRALASQIVDTAAVHNMVKCTTQDQLFQGIEDALGEIGLPDMSHFIRQELAMQVQVRFQIDASDKKGIPIKPTGALPKSLQVMSSSIKEKHEIHYHQEMKEREKYPEVANYDQEKFEKNLQKIDEKEDSEDRHQRMENLERERIVNNFN